MNELALLRQQAVVDYLIETLSVAPERLVQSQNSSAGGIVSGGDSPRAVISLTDGYGSDDEEQEAVSSEASP